MALTMYDLTIPTLLRGFDVLSMYLEKAAAFTLEEGVAPTEFIQSKLCL